MMLKFLQSIIKIPTKLRLFDQISIKLERLKQNNQQLIQENYRLSQNLTASLQKIQDLQSQLIQCQFPEPEMTLSLDETFDSNDLVAIEQLVQEFNK